MCYLTKTFEDNNTSHLVRKNFEFKFNVKLKYIKITREGRCHRSYVIILHKLKNLTHKVTFLSGFRTLCTINHTYHDSFFDLIMMNHTRLFS